MEPNNHQKLTEQPNQPTPQPQPVPSPYSQPAMQQQVPGKGISVAGFILALLGLVTFGLTSLIGLILSIIGRVQTKRVGQPSGMALAGIIISIITMIIGVIVAVLLFIFVFSQGAKLQDECRQRGPGEHYIQWLGSSSRLTCDSRGNFQDINTN